MIDSLPEPPHWSQAIFIKQRTLEILSGLGLVSRFIDEGQWVRRISFYSDGRDFASYSFEAIDSPFQNMLSIPESSTIRLLIEHLEMLGGRVEYGTVFTGLTQNDRDVSVQLETAAGGPTAVNAPYVIGADGYRSLVREAIGAAYEGSDYKELWGVFDTHLANWTRPRDTVCAQLEAPLVLPFPLGADRWRIYFRPQAAVGAASVAQVLARLRVICPDTVLVAPEPPQYFHSHSRLARTFRVGRVFLAGDAAHASNPIQGHGMNAGIQDANNLGFKLAAVVNGHGSEALLNSYDAERRNIDRAVVDAGEEAYGWMTDSSGEKIAELYAFLRTPEGQALAAIAETEIEYCYEPSTIIQDLRADPAEVQRVGTRACNVEGLVFGSQVTSLHALLAHGEFTVLLLTGSADATTLNDVRPALASCVNAYEGVRLLDVRLGAHPQSGAPDQVLGDPDGQLHERYGAKDPMICVIRPDGHISLCCSANPTILNAHLSTMLVSRTLKGASLHDDPGTSLLPL